MLFLKSFSSGLLLIVYYQNLNCQDGYKGKGWIEGVLRDTPLRLPNTLPEILNFYLQHCSGNVFGYIIMGSEMKWRDHQVI